MSAFSTATAAAFTTLLRVAGETITYARGEVSAEISAVPGDTLAEVVNDEGAVIRVRVRDYIAKASTLADEFGSPQRGDRITQTLGGEEKTYEVLGPSGRPVFEWWDKAGAVYRIHTQEIDSEVAD